MRPDPDRTGGGADGCSCGLALSGRMGQAYNEEALRYFLAVEAQRAARSGRPLFVLVVELAESRPIGPAVASKLFEGLWASLRETDFVGWHREGRAVAAVLTEFADEAGPESPRRLRERIGRALTARLPTGLAGSLQLRVHRHSEPQTAGIAGSGG